MYLYIITLVGHLDQRVEAHVDLGLAGGGDLVVVHLDGMPHSHHRQHHLGADILQRSVRRHREVAFLVARLVAEVGACSSAAGVPVPSAEST